MEGRSMTSNREIERQLARRDIVNADREIARLCEQIRAIERRIKAQERIRREANRKLDGQ
jgi:hypothetical protein